MKIKFFKIKKDYKKEDFRINPSIFWRILVIVALMLLVVSFIFSYNLFRQTNKQDDLMIGENNGENRNKEKEKIKEVLDYFSEREKKSTEILNSPVTIVDPSL